MELTQFFIELHKKEAEAETTLSKIRTAIKATQEICEHDFQLIGNTHKDIYECKICKKRT